MSRRGRHHEEPPPGYTEQGSLLVPHALGDVDDEPREGCEGDHGGEAPDRPEAARAQYAEILQRLQARVVGHEPVLRRLALAGVQHMMGSAGQRYLLVGPTGAG